MRGELVWFPIDRTRFGFYDRIEGVAAFVHSHMLNDDPWFHEMEVVP